MATGKISSSSTENSRAERNILRRMIRQVAIDTTSNILGIVDGTIDFPLEIKLVDPQTGDVFEDELQDTFLALVEDESNAGPA